MISVSHFNTETANDKHTHRAELFASSEKLTVLEQDILFVSKISFSGHWIRPM